MNKIKFNKLQNKNKKKKKLISITFMLLALSALTIATLNYTFYSKKSNANLDQNLAVAKSIDLTNIKNKLDNIVNNRIPIVSSVYSTQTFSNEINLIKDFILKEDEENALISLNTLEESIENHISLIKNSYNSILDRQISRGASFKDDYKDKLINEIKELIPAEDFKNTEFKINILKYKIDNLLYDSGQSNCLEPLILDGIIIVNKHFGLPANYGSGLDEKTLKAFETMEAAASKNGISLYVASGFRNYYKQDDLFYNYYAQYGEEAKRFSSLPGHSEHQTGLAIDIGGVDEYAWVKSDFYNTEEFKWLETNCYKYGFILRYPENKEDITGYMFESWHYRYVGTELSTYLHENNLTLEEYFDID